MRKTSEFKKKLIARREKARVMVQNQTLEKQEIAKIVGVLPPTLSQWIRLYGWVNENSWPVRARFDRPGMLVSELELARESAAMKEAYRKFRAGQLAAI